MAVRVRLRRIGKNPKKRPHFRLSVFEQHCGRDGRFIEELGYYNPVTGASKIKMERLEYWARHGAELSATIKSLMKKKMKEAKDATRSS